MPYLEWLEEIRKDNEGNPESQKLISKYQEGGLSRHYSIREGIMYYKGRMYVARSLELKTKLLQFLHNSPWGASRGR